MAHTITLGNGTLTVDLFALATSFVTGDGWRMASGDGDVQEVGEALTLLVQGATTAALQAWVTSVDRLLAGARRRALSGVGARVWLTVQLDGEAQAWRSEVRDGRLDMGNALEQWHRRKVQVTLGLTRRNWWEGASDRA